MEEFLSAIERFLINTPLKIYSKGLSIKNKNLIEFVYKIGDIIKAYVKSENLYFKDRYKVVIKFNKSYSIIEDSSCECPYYLEYGKTCKHIVASLLYLKDILRDKNKEITIDNFLKSLSPEEKDNLLKDLIIFNQTIYDELMERFNIKIILFEKKGDIFNENIERKYRNLFKNIFSNLINSISKYGNWYIDEGLEDFEALYKMKEIFNSITTIKEKFIFLKIFFKNYLDLIYLDEDIFYNINDYFLDSINKFFIERFKEISKEEEIRKKVLEFICRELNFNIYPEFDEVSLFKTMLEVAEDREDYEILHNCLKFYNIENLEILTPIYKVLDISKYLKIVKDNKYTSSYIQRDYVDYLIKNRASKEDIKYFLYDIKDSIKSKENLEYFLKLDKEIVDIILKKAFYRKLITEFYELKYLKDLKDLLSEGDWKTEALRLEKKLLKTPIYLIGFYIFEGNLDYAIKTLKNLKFETLGDALVRYMEYFRNEKYIKDFASMLYEYVVYAINLRKNRESYTRTMDYLEQFLKFPEFRIYILEILNRLKEKYPKRYALHEEIEKLLERI